MKKLSIKNEFSISPHLVWLMMVVVFFVFSISLFVMDGYSSNSFIKKSDFSIVGDQNIENVSSIIDNNNFFHNDNLVNNTRPVPVLCDEKECEKNEEVADVLVEQEQKPECSDDILPMQYKDDQYDNYKNGKDLDAELILENFYVDDCGVLIADFSWNILPKKDIYILQEQSLKLHSDDDGFSYFFDISSGTQVENARGFKFINHRVQALTIRVYIGSFDESGIYEISLDYILYRDNNSVLRKYSVKNTKSIKVHFSSSEKITILD